MGITVAFVLKLALFHCCTNNILSLKISLFNPVFGVSLGYIVQFSIKVIVPSLRPEKSLKLYVPKVKTMNLLPKKSGYITKFSTSLGYT